MSGLAWFDEDKPKLRQLPARLKDTFRSQVWSLAQQPSGHRYLLPDVCLSEGRFLDGTTIDELPRPVEVVATDGISLRKALEPS